MNPLTRFLMLAAAVAGAASLGCVDSQPLSGPGPLILAKHVGDQTNPCVSDRDRDKRTAPLAILCAIAVPDNPLTNVAKGWFVHERHAYYIADQSNHGVDVIDLKSYAYAGRIPGFTGTATYGGGTATTNGQGPNSMVETDGHLAWVSEGNSTVRIVDLNALAIVASVSTADPSCDGGTASTHFCGRDNEMTYDPEDHLIFVINPNPLDLTYCTTAGNNCATTAAQSYPTATPRTLAPYATLISTHPPYHIVGRIRFTDDKGTPEGPVWSQHTHRFLVPVPTCSGTTGATACSTTTGGTEYIAVIDPDRFAKHGYTVQTWTQGSMPSFAMPDCAHLMPAISPVPTGMINDMSIDDRDRHVLMPACGRGEVVFDERTGDVVHVVTEISGSDETWFNDGDGRFYVAANDPANSNTRSLGVIDGRSGMWLQNVADVGGATPAASDDANRVFTTVTASANPTACTQFGLPSTAGCVTVFEHEDGKPDH